MKKQAGIILLFLATCMLSACSENDDPDAAAQVAGTYELTKQQLDSAGMTLYDYTLPLTVGGQSLSGTVVVRRDSARVVYASYTIRQTGQSDFKAAFGQLSLRRNATPYDLFYGNTKVGLLTENYSPLTCLYRPVFSGRKE